MSVQSGTGDESYWRLAGNTVLIGSTAWIRLCCASSADDATAATLQPLTKRQQNQSFMVNALLSVVVYFVLQWHRVTVSFQVA
jgi:hypothetical protein